jgi:hypothetical protein
MDLAMGQDLFCIWRGGAYLVFEPGAARKFTYDSDFKPLNTMHSDYYRIFRTAHILKLLLRIPLIFGRFFL